MRYHIVSVVSTMACMLAVTSMFAADETSTKAEKLTEYSMRCVGFVTTLLRGTEWAATGDVTLPIPEDFPTADAASSREP